MKNQNQVLANLKSDETVTVLNRLLSLHPNLKGEAEQIAKLVVLDVNFEVIADEVKSAMHMPNMDDLNSRAGSHGGGYKDPSEAAWELLEEEVEPFLVEMRRYFKLGMRQEALETCKGIVLGLYQVYNDDEKGDDDVLEWATDFFLETAGFVVEEWQKNQNEKSFPSEFIKKFMPDWAKYIK